MGDGDGSGDGGGTIFPGHPGPFPNAPRDNISREGILSLRHFEPTGFQCSGVGFGACGPDRCSGEKGRPGCLKKERLAHNKLL